jgi:hypothetical protein
MARVLLNLKLPPTFNDPFMVAWTIINADLEVVRSGTFFNDSHASAEVDPGKYWARVQLPGNQTKSKSFEVRSAADSVTLDFDFPVSSRHEWLGWATVNEAAKLVEQRGPSRALEDLWVRAWEFSAHRWEPTEQAVHAPLYQDDGVFQLDMIPGQQRLLALQIGGDSIESRLLVIPAAGVTRVLITATAPSYEASKEASSEEGIDALQIVPSLPDSVADHLSRYLVAGSPGSRGGIDAALLRGQGIELLAGKRQDPLGAAVGGYFLLQNQSQSRSAVPVQWLKNLADWNEWLADGAILYAYTLLSTEGRGRAPEAIQYLLKGTQRGFPVFRRGIDLFLDACRLLRSPQSPPPADLEECIDLFAAVRASSTGQGAFTAFFGNRPDEPRALSNRSKMMSQEFYAGPALNAAPTEADFEPPSAGVRALSRRS